MKRMIDRPKPLPDDRPGTALIVVLVVVASLALAAYTFSELMIVERQASNRYGRDAAARAFADSGIEAAAAWIGTPPEEDGTVTNLYHNPELFAGIAMVDTDVAGARGQFSLLAPLVSTAAGASLRSGLIDESSKLNVNAIPGYGLDEDLSRELLMYLPDMTEDVADAILDWIDADAEVRLYGAEDEAYLPDGFARNAPLESIDELLNVVGVTADLLYGEDTNRNGLLDPNEDNGDLSAPPDNADGILNPGWSGYLTIYSRESNLRPDGSAKINLNQPLLTELYDTLEEEFGTEIATFITAYRLAGSTNIEKIEAASTGDELTDEELQKGAQEVAGALFGGEGKVTRGGMDLSEGPTYDFYSLYDLIGAEVEVPMGESESSGGGSSGGGSSGGGSSGGGNSGGGSSGGGSSDNSESPPGETLFSPWTNAPADMTQSLPMLFENFTLSDDEFVEGRINVSQAPYEVLLGLPDMPPELPDLIVSANESAGLDAVVTDVTRQTSGWLWINGLTDQLTLRKLDRYLTVRGGVYRATSVGYFDRGGPLVRVEAVIDGTMVPPRIIFQRDLSHLGPGYRIDQLSQLSGQ